MTMQFLLTCFKKHILAEDQDVLDQCLDDSSDKDSQDAINFFSCLKCFKVASQENISELLMS